MNQGSCRKLRLIFTITSVLFLSGAVQAGEAARIMPLGDSITRGWLGSAHAWGYRKPLYDLLTSGGYDFDFVGRKIDGAFADPNHEGRDGWRTDDIINGKTGYPAEGKLADWLVADQPDIILLHIGTNDITQGYRDANKVNAILDIIEAYENNNNRNVTVILALMVNRRIDDLAERRIQTTQFNSDVNTIAMNRIANGDDIIIVDMESALDYAIGADMADEVHPNDTGYAKMAQVWYDALVDYFDSAVFVISGHVREAGGLKAVEGMLITSESNDVNTFTDANGFYELQVGYHWSGVTKPKKDGFVIEPNGYVYSNVDQNLTNMDYTAAPTTVTISGYVLEQGSAAPISGVSILADNDGGTAITGENGYYELNINLNWSGNVTAEKYSYIFEPTSRHYEDVNQDFAGDQNFSSTKYDFRIYGFIRNECSVPAEGVLVEPTSGGAGDTTDSNGFYEVWVNQGWSGTVTPSKTNFTFESALTNFEQVQADQQTDYLADNIYDLDCDNRVDWADVFVMAGNWLSTEPGAAGNLVADERVNFLDFAFFMSMWQN